MHESIFYKLILFYHTISNPFPLYFAVASAGVYIIATSAIIIFLIVIILAIYSRHGAKYYTHEDRVGKSFYSLNYI